MIDKINARKTAKNLLLGKTCKECAFSIIKKESIAPLGPGDIDTYFCTLCDEKTEEDQSCMFWISGEPNENWLEFIKREGFLLEDIKKYWIK